MFWISVAIFFIRVGVYVDYPVYDMFMRKKSNGTSMKNKYR